MSAASPTGSLRLVDCSPAVKFALQAEPAGAMAAQLAVEPGQMKQFFEGFLVACSAPGEWLLLAPGDAGPFLRRLRAAAPGEHLAAVDITHGRTLLRLTGPSAAEVISTLCALDLSDRGCPPGSATYAPVAGVRTGILRDDVSAEEAGWPPPDDGDAEGSGATTPAAQGAAASAPVPSYLLHCDRSLGRHLHEELVWAGKRLGLEIEGFAPYRARRDAV